MSSEPTEADVGFVADLATGHWKSAIVHALTRYDVCDAISSLSEAAAAVAEGAAASDVAAKCGTDPRTTYRLLRAASSLGLVEEKPEERFVLTAKGKLLTADHPLTAKKWYQWESSPTTRKVWLEFDTTVQTGQPGIKGSFGVDSFWELVKSDTGPGELFNSAMTDVTRSQMRSILAAYDFSWAKTFVDIAGGRGVATFLLLERYPEMHGTVADLPDVCLTAPVPEHLKGRVTLKGFDLFDSVSYPRGADVYFMKLILHDWDDAHCIQILQNIAGAMRPDSRIVVADACIPPPNKEGFGKIFDLHMLTLLNGAERTEAEIRTLAKAAGLEVTATVKTPAQWVFEMRKAHA